MDLRKFLMYQLSAAQAQVAALEHAIKGLDGEGGETTPAPAKETKTEKKSGKGAAKTKPVETEPEAQVDDAVEADDLDMDLDAVDGSEEPTLDDVRKVVKDFATKHGKEKALKLLSKFNVTSIPDIKKADYAKVIELAKKHL